MPPKRKVGRPPKTSADWALTPAQHRHMIEFTAATGVLSRDKLVSEANRIGITRRQLVRWLERHPLWQQMRPISNDAGAVIRSVQSGRPWTYFQADIGHLPQLAAANGGYQYFLVARDMFSRAIRAQPLKTTSQRDATRAMEAILNQFPPDQVRVVQTDNGVEFDGEFDDMLRARRITHRRGRAAVPQTQGGAESAVKSVKIMLHNAMRLRQTLRWIDLLGQVVEQYNALPNSTVGMPPTALDRLQNTIPPQVLATAKANMQKMWARVSGRRPRLLEELHVGDLVRYNIRSKNPLRKSWQTRWSAKVYTIQEVLRKRDDQGVLVRYVLNGLPGSHPRRALLPVKDPFPIPVMQNVGLMASVAEQREAAALRRENREREAHARRVAAGAAVVAGRRAGGGGAAGDSDSGSGDSDAPAPARPVRVRRLPARLRD